MKNIKISMILNTLIVILVTIGTIFMFTGFTFMPADTLLEATRKEMFKFYTVDSNILMGLVALLLLVYEVLLYKGKIKEIPKVVYNLKFVGTAAIALTFVVTLFFLAPMYGFYAMYNNNNLFFHLFVPVLAIISFIVVEKYDISYRTTFFGVLPMLLYSIYYATNILIHLENGKPTWQYDFYNFLNGNVNNIFITIPIILIVTYAIALVLTYLNKKLLKK